MNSIMDRLTDAMNAAADTVQEEGLRPLVARERWWRHSAWTAPLAAAVAAVLVIGMAVSLTHGLFGIRRPARPLSPPAAPHRFYMTVGHHRFYIAAEVHSLKIVVHSAATGKAVSVVPVWKLAYAPGEHSLSPVFASAGNGLFFVAVFQQEGPDEEIFWYQLSADGQIERQGVGGALGPGWVADMLAATPHGTLVAVGASYTDNHIGPPWQPWRHNNRPWRTFNGSDEVIVDHSGNVGPTYWSGGALGRYKYFSVRGLSFTGNGRELAVLGQWCDIRTSPGDESCPRPGRQTQVRAIDPASLHGGSVSRGQLLRRAYP